MRKLIIAIDFDGCIVSNRYPEIGVLRSGARDTINKWYENHTIIINSCRSGSYSEDMFKFILDNKINCHYINENSQELIEKYNGDTRKISADIYFDDHNAGGFNDWKWADQKVLDAERFKPIIVCIVGESGSGKSTLGRKIEEVFGHTLIRSYTDRARRDENDDHTFLSPQEFDLLDPKEMIAYTKFGNHRYCCLTSDVREFNTYIIDEVGLNMLTKNWGEVYDIRSIRLLCSERERISRVGTERVSRDIGKFNMPMQAFDDVLVTDEPYYVSSLKHLMY